MRHYRHSTSRQNSHKTSHLIRRHERRKIARAQMLPVALLPLFECLATPPEVAPAAVPNESYAVVFLAKRGGISTSLARVYAELNNFGGEYR